MTIWGQQVLPWLVIGISGLLFFDWVNRNVIGLELSLMTAGAMHIVVAFRNPKRITQRSIRR